MLLSHNRFDKNKSTIMESLKIIQLTPSDLQELIEQSLNKVFDLKINNKESQNIKTLLTIDEASKFLSLSKTTLYSKVSRREIPFMKRSKRLYFSQEELISYVKEGRKQTTDEVQSEPENYLKKKGDEK